MKVFGLTTNPMVKVSKPIYMMPLIKESLRMVKRMDMEFSHGLITLLTKVIGRMISLIIKVSIFGLTVGHIMVSGN